MKGLVYARRQTLGIQREPAADSRLHQHHQARRQRALLKSRWRNGRKNPTDPTQQLLPNNYTRDVGVAVWGQGDSYICAYQIAVICVQCCLCYSALEQVKKLYIFYINNACGVCTVLRALRL